MSPRRPAPDPLLDELAELREEVRVLRLAVDELTEAVTWQNNNAQEYPALVGDRSRLWTLAAERLPGLVAAVRFPAPVEKAGDDAPPPEQGPQKTLF